MELKATYTVNRLIKELVKDKKVFIFNMGFQTKVQHGYKMNHNNLYAKGITEYNDEYIIDAQSQRTRYICFYDKRSK